MQLLNNSIRATITLFKYISILSSIKTLSTLSKGISLSACNGRITVKVEAQRSVESSCIENTKLRRKRNQGERSVLCPLNAHALPMPMPSQRPWPPNAHALSLRRQHYRRRFLGVGSSTWNQSQASHVTGILATTVTAPVYNFIYLYI
jgi:hypothetical protein